MDDYIGIVDSPRNAIADRKALGNSLKVLFQELYTIFDERMNTLAVALQKYYPEFYEEYKDNCLIHDTVTRPTQAAGTIIIKRNDDTLKVVLINGDGQVYFTFRKNLKCPGKKTPAVRNSNRCYFFRPTAFFIHLQ